MTEEDFRSQAIASGFADFQIKRYASDIDGPLHAHDFAVTLLVTEGEFALQYEDRKDRFQIGECCNLKEHVLHAERAGPKGAVVIVAKRAQNASVAPMS